MNDAFPHSLLASAAPETLRSLIDLVGAVLFIVEVEPDGTLRFGGFNRTYEQATGLRSADYEGRTPGECLPPKTAEWVSARYRDCLAAGESFEYQERLDLGARETWWRTTLMPMREAATGRIFRLIGSTVDITAERAAQAELRRLARLYQESFDRTPVMKVTLDSERRILRASDYLLRRLGYRREEMLGRLIGDFLSPASATMGREVVVPRLLQDGEARDIAYTLLTATGEPLEALVSAVAIRDPEGRLLEFNAVALEVTPLTEANRRLAERERSERERYDRTPAMLYTLGPDFRIVGVSDHWLQAMGYRREQVIGRLPFDFMTEAAMVRAREAVIPAMLEHGRIDDVPYELYRADGSVIEVLLSATSERDTGGGFIRIHSVMRDVTERNAAYRELEAAAAQLAEKNRELEQFAHIASHDLREPLRKVRAFADRLRGKCGERLGEDGRQYLDRIEISVDRMRVLIQDLLWLSLASSQEIRPVPVDLGAAVRQAVADLDDEIQRQGAAVSIAGAFVPVPADPIQIGQLFANLIGNALKFRLPGRTPSVTVSGEISPEGVRIRVRDNGVGFDPAQRERILQPFVRLHTRSAYDGTGMGLAICQKIVSRHNGRLFADGCPGEGATFTVELPRRRGLAGG